MLRRIAVVSLAAICLLAFALPASAAIRIKSIAFDPPGEDAAPEPNSDLNKELVKICNTAKRAKKMSKWKLTDRGADHRFVFPKGFKLRGKRCVKVHTGSGNANRKHQYFGNDAYIWNNDGDKATLKTRRGRRVDKCSYSGGSSPASC